MCWAVAPEPSPTTGPDNPPTTAGVRTSSSVVPGSGPTCPRLLRPKQVTVPPASSAQVWLAPAARATAAPPGNAGRRAEGRHVLRVAGAAAQAELPVVALAPAGEGARRVADAGVVRPHRQLHHVGGRGRRRARGRC